MEGLEDGSSEECSGGSALLDPAAAAAAANRMGAERRRTQQATVMMHKNGLSGEADVGGYGLAAASVAETVNDDMNVPAPTGAAVGKLTGSTEFDTTSPDSVVKKKKKKVHFVSPADADGQSRSTYRSGHLLDEETNLRNSSTDNAEVMEDDEEETASGSLGRNWLLDEEEDEDTEEEDDDTEEEEAVVRAEILPDEDAVDVDEVPSCSLMDEEVQEETEVDNSRGETQGEGGTAAIKTEEVEEEEEERDGIPGRSRMEEDDSSIRAVYHGGDVAQVNRNGASSEREEEGNEGKQMMEDDDSSMRAVYRGDDVAQVNRNDSTNSEREEEENEGSKKTKLNIASGDGNHQNYEEEEEEFECDEQEEGKKVRRECKDQEPPKRSYFRKNSLLSKEKRGVAGMRGSWISLEEATKRGLNEEWWARGNSEGKKVTAQQHVLGAPKDKPVWIFEDQDMYLGSWKEKSDYYGNPVEHGFGIWYSHKKSHRGLITIGEFQNGVQHGACEMFYLESSESWQQNRSGVSPIRRWNQIKGRGSNNRGVPFRYIGDFERGYMCDDAAIVTLKDGTIRRGPWFAGAPDGDWDQDHELIARGTDMPTATNMGKESGGSLKDPPSSSEPIGQPNANLKKNGANPWDKKFEQFSTYCGRFEELTPRVDLPLYKWMNNLKRLVEEGSPRWRKLNDIGYWEHLQRHNAPLKNGLDKMWDKNFEKLSSYRGRFGELKQKDDIQLYNWVNVLERRVEEGSSRWHELDEIGYWDYLGKDSNLAAAAEQPKASLQDNPKADSLQTRREKEWDEKFQKFSKLYRGRFGDLTPKVDRHLYDWMKYSEYKSEEGSERWRKLNDIGYWEYLRSRNGDRNVDLKTDQDKQWDQNFVKLSRYRGRFEETIRKDDMQLYNWVGNLERRVKYDSPRWHKLNKIGYWEFLGKQRSLTAITAEQPTASLQEHAKADSLQERREKEWDEKFMKLSEYRGRFAELNASVDLPLSKWKSNLKHYVKEGSPRWHKLNGIGYWEHVRNSENRHDERWNAQFEKFSKYRGRFGELTTKVDLPLYKWMKKYEGIEEGNPRWNKLNDIGFWDYLRRKTEPSNQDVVSIDESSSEEEEEADDEGDPDVPTAGMQQTKADLKSRYDKRWDEQFSKFSKYRGRFGELTRKVDSQLYDWMKKSEYNSEQGSARWHKLNDIGYWEYLRGKVTGGKQQDNGGLKRHHEKRWNEQFEKFSKYQGRFEELTPKVDQQLYDWMKRSEHRVKEGSPRWHKLNDIGYWEYSRRHSKVTAGKQQSIAALKSCKHNRWDKLWDETFEKFSKYSGRFDDLTYKVDLPLYNWMKKWQYEAKEGTRRWNKLNDIGFWDHVGRVASTDEFSSDEEEETDDDCSAAEPTATATPKKRGRPPKAKDTPAKVIEQPRAKKQRRLSPREDTARAPVSSTKKGMKQENVLSRDESSSDEEEENDNERIRRLRRWITEEVFGVHMNPSKNKMKFYSERLFEQGFDSVEIIKAMLSERDVNEYDWMAPIHKRIFVRRIQEGW